MAMSKRTVYTIITPLPPQISRETVLTAFHDHGLMIELNPFVIRHTECKPPRFSPADEYHSQWYEITDKVHYSPGGAISGKVVYHACLHDLPNGLQTHCYAALGTDIRGKWLLCGTLPGEPRETPELGIDAPLEGLYVREDIDMKTNFMMTSFVKKNLAKSHTALLQRLIVGVSIVDAHGTAPAAPSFSSHSGVSPSATSPSFISSVSSAPSKTTSPMLQRQSMRDVVDQRATQGTGSKNASPNSAYASPSSLYAPREMADPGHPHYVAELSGQSHVPELDSTPVAHHMDHLQVKPAVPDRNPGRNSSESYTFE